MNSDIVHRLGYVVFIHGSGVRLPVSEIIFKLKFCLNYFQITYICKIL